MHRVTVSVERGTRGVPFGATTFAPETHVVVSAEDGLEALHKAMLVLRTEQTYREQKAASELEEQA